MPPFTELEGESDHLMIYDKVYVKIVCLSLTMLNLYRCFINLVSPFNWPCYVFLT